MLDKELREDKKLEKYKLWAEVATWFTRQKCRGCESIEKVFSDIVMILFQEKREW